MSDAHGYTPRAQTPLLLSRLQRWLVSAGLVALMVFSWTGILEQSTGTKLEATLQRALVTAAIARGLNGIISVAQGTEIAIQPIGVGVTLSVGEILDPLNDLVERFSWLALVAAASLGTQLLLTEIVAAPALNIALTAVLCCCLVLVWWPGVAQRYSWILRIALLVVFARFLFTTVGLVTGWVDGWVLAERQEVAMSSLTNTREEIEVLSAAPPPTLADPSFLSRFESLLDNGRQLFDIQAQLKSLEERVESSIDQLLDLIVLFLVQTLVLPLATLWLSVAGFRSFWAWLARAP